MFLNDSYFLVYNYNVNFKVLVYNFNVQFKTLLSKHTNANPKWIYVLGADSQKELELQVKDYLKFIEDNTK